MIARLPLRLRLALAFALASAALLAIIGLVLRASLASGMEEAVADGLRVRAGEVVALIKGAGPDGLTGVALAEPDEGFAQVLGSDGRVLASSPGLPPGPVAGGGDLARALSGPAAVRSGAPGDDGQALVLARPAAAEGEPVVVVVGASLEPRDEAVARLTALLLLAGPVALAVVAGGAYLLAAAALRPVERMRARAERISLAGPGARLPLPPARDELRRLGRTLNDLLERVDRALARERAFVADASHQLRTPLAVLSMELELAGGRRRSPQELRAAVAAASDQAGVVSRLAENLLATARAEDGQPALHLEDVDAGAVARTIAGRHRERARRTGRALTVAAEPGLALPADRIRLEQAVENLIDNALRHGGGAVAVTARAEGDDVVLEVADEGGGFDPEVAGRAFERFARGAGPGRGAGLGLAVARAVARAHGGDAHIARAAPGAAVVLRLPRAGPPGS